MGRNKQVECEICFKTLPSDNLDRYYQNKHILGYFTSSSKKETKVTPSREKFKVSQPQHTSSNTQILAQIQSDDINLKSNYVKLVAVCCSILFLLLFRII